MDTNGIFPSTMGDLQVMSGDVDSLVQVVSQAENSSFQELFPSPQVPLECCTCMMLYGISLKSESSKLHQASKLEFCVVGVFFFPDDCWILTGQLWDVGWLWWLNWKSHTIPTIPWVSSEFLQVYHQFREFRSSLFQESVAAESDSWDITLIVQRVVFSCFFNDQDSSIFQSMIVLMAFTSVPCASRSYTLQRQTFKSFNGLAKMHHEPCITSLIKWCSPKSSKWCMIKLCITPW